jgi:hypothetical protein
MFQHTLTRIFLLSSLSFLAACGGGGLTSTGGSVGAGSSDGDGGDTGGTFFAIADLDGDWTGELLPGDPLQGDRNFYLRMLSGALLDSAEGGGGSWDPGTATLDVTFTTDGFLGITLHSPTTGDLFLEGAMNLARNTINGSFVLADGTPPAIEGTFELRLSGGAGTFTQALLAGEWNGEVLNSADRFRLSLLELGVDGELVQGALTKPSSQAVVHYYRPAENTGPESIFTFFDSAIGRLDIVTLYGTDGSDLTFTYLLVNDTGTLMSGPGEDSVLGVGHVELSRPQ